MKRNPDIAQRWWKPPQEVEPLLTFDLSAFKMVIKICSG